MRYILISILTALLFSSCHKPRLHKDSPMVGKFLYEDSFSWDTGGHFTADQFDKIEIQFKSNGKMKLFEAGKEVETAWLTSKSEDDHYFFKSDEREWEFYFINEKLVSESYPVADYYNRYGKEE